MWVADMDFRPPQVVQDALQRHASITASIGYFGDDGAYTGRDPLVDGKPPRLEDRAGLDLHHHTGWSTAIGICVDTYTAPGDGIVLFTPVYHAFARGHPRRRAQGGGMPDGYWKTAATRWISTPMTRR